MAPARRHTVGPSLAPTLGLTRTTCGAPSGKHAETLTPRVTRQLRSSDKRHGIHAINDSAGNKGMKERKEDLSGPYESWATAPLHELKRKTRPRPAILAMLGVLFAVAGLNAWVMVADVLLPLWNKPTSNTIMWAHSVPVAGFFLLLISALLKWRHKRITALGSGLLAVLTPPCHSPHQSYMSIKAVIWVIPHALCTKSPGRKWCISEKVPHTTSSLPTQLVHTGLYASLAVSSILSQRENL